MLYHEFQYVKHNEVVKCDLLSSVDGAENKYT